MRDTRLSRLFHTVQERKMFRQICLRFLRNKELKLVKCHITIIVLYIFYKVSIDIVVTLSPQQQQIN